MSEDPADFPSIPPSRGEEPRPEPGLGLIVLGIVLGAPALYALYFGTTSGIAPNEGYRTFLSGPRTFIPIAAYLVVAVVLTVRPRTSGLGAGLLIGLGIFTLLGGGLCVAYLAQVRG